MLRILQGLELEMDKFCWGLLLWLLSWWIFTPTPPREPLVVSWWIFYPYPPPREPLVVSLWNFHQESFLWSRGEFFIPTPHQESLSWSRCKFFTKRASRGLVVNFSSLPPTKRASRGLVLNFSPREPLMVNFLYPYPPPREYLVVSWWIVCLYRVSQKNEKFKNYFWRTLAPYRQHKSFQNPTLLLTIRPSTHFFKKQL